MTDLELTKACALAMGYKIYQENSTYVHCEETGYYDPLTQDAHAMVLLKKFRLCIDALQGKEWVVTDDEIVTEHVDLNRAIVECIAKLQEAKP